ncbi:MAG: hypothetical protein JWP01_2798 [Myxococcales bacterium]|nr:hypothetical protein [Myxococcales bacterium]
MASPLQPGGPQGGGFGQKVVVECADEFGQYPPVVHLGTLVTVRAIFARVGARRMTLALFAAFLGIGCSSPAASVCDGGDCEPGCELATWFADEDADGFGAADDHVEACDAPAGHVADATDCDDTVASIRPSATELCNGTDDDCDGTVDENLTSLTWYADGDGDGAGAPGTAVVSCDMPLGHVATALDCNDANDTVHPGASELCNAVDDDCDATFDEGAPGTFWYLDLDHDGYGAPGAGVMSCGAPADRAGNDLDCNDADDGAHPGAAETCGTVDRNCDGVVQPCCGDGFANLEAGEQCDGVQDGACIGQCNACMCPAPGPWRFTDATSLAGLDVVQGYTVPAMPSQPYYGGGLAASDLDNDGDIDLYTVRGEIGRSVLWINQGNGTFVDGTASAQIPLSTVRRTGPLFADFNGDGADDLLLGGVVGAPVRVFINQRNGTFADGTIAAGFATLGGEVVSAAMADLDGDGDLDLALGRAGTTMNSGVLPCSGPPPMNIEHLWRNDGGLFVPISVLAGLSGLVHPVLCWDTTFTPTFDYFNGDDSLDLAFTADHGDSRLYLGLEAGGFAEITTASINDEYGMGAATGDVDNDGDIDWFVTSIQGTINGTGNRLFLNDGSGGMSDSSASAGVRRGGWGWGACMADFNSDGHLDIFHVNAPLPVDLNGNSTPVLYDASRLFLSNGDGTFTERSFELGIVDFDQGRGVSCFDSDNDGDVDIVVSNEWGPLRLWRNNGARVGHYFVVSLSAPPPNARGIGARIELTSSATTQRRTIKAGNNFVSQDPALAHFGLGAATTVDTVRVRWPDGTVTTQGPFSADQRIVITKP